jgi:hypothetical protein
VIGLPWGGRAGRASMGHAGCQSDHSAAFNTVLPPARADRNGQDDDAGAPDVGKNHDLADSSVPVTTTNHLTQQPVMRTSAPFPGDGSQNCVAACAPSPGCSGRPQCGRTAGGVQHGGRVRSDAPHPGGKQPSLGSGKPPISTAGCRCRLRAVRRHGPWSERRGF